MLFRQIFYSGSATYTYLLAAHRGQTANLFCSFGERSVMAVEAAKEAGLENVASVASVVGGIKAWMKAGGPVVYDETISQDAGGT
jgi:rhodanese-related sulfurtransferase